jgi:ABC-2 type transport system permease protein
MSGPASTSALGPVLALAGKDLRLLVRNRAALFFSLGWPVLIALFFGLIFGGGGERGRIQVGGVDEDGSPAAAALLQRLSATDGVQVTPLDRAEAEARVRAGKLTAAVIVPRGYAEAEARLFHGAPRRLELAVDPARGAEAAMLEGILTGAAMQSMQDLFSGGEGSRRQVDTALADLRRAPPGTQRASTERFLGELGTFLDTRPAAAPATAGASPVGGAGAGGAGGWKPLEIEKRTLRADRAGPSSAFDITFPQGMIWGVIGCSLGFALSLVQERTRGTLTRLRAAPLSAGHVLAGKALACFTAIIAVEALLFAVGRLGFSVRPSSWGLAAAAAVSVAICFVGIMMLVAVLGKTEQAASGLGWAIMMPLTMLGGGMVPLFAMPSWMQAAGTLSPVKWSILALEGAIWRGFTPAQLALPCAVLVSVGVAGFAIGAWRYGRAGG